MVDTSDNPNKLFMPATGNAVLSTTLVLPSPVNLTLSDENPQSEQLGIPILLSRPNTCLTAENTTAVNGVVDIDIPEELVCNGEGLDLLPNRSEACMMRVKQDW